MAPAAEVESARGNRGQGREPIYGQQSGGDSRGGSPFLCCNQLQLHFMAVAYNGARGLSRDVARIVQNGPSIFQLPPPFSRGPHLGLLGSIVCDCVWLWGNKYTSQLPRRPAWVVSVPNYLYVANIGQHTQQRDASTARRGIARPSAAHTAHLMRYCNELQLQLIVGSRGS